MANELVLHTEDLIENPTPRVPITLCLDTSYSMSGEPINELMEGVALFYESVYNDEIARYSAEISIVTFGNGGVQRVADFGPVERIPKTRLVAGGNTPMGEAVCDALDILEKRKREYQNTGVDYYQPWLVLMTDGMPTDDVNEAVKRVVSMVNQKKLSVFPIGIGDGADMGILSLFNPTRTPLRLQGLKFREFFEWLSASVQRVSASTPGENVPLDVDGIKGWAEI